MTTVRLVRPVLLSALDTTAHASVERARSLLGREVEPLRVIRTDDVDGLTTVRAAKIEQEVIGSLHRAPWHQQVIDWGVHWIVVGYLDQDMSAGERATPAPPSSSRALIEEIVPVAERLKQNGFPLRLTVLLADTSIGVGSAFGETFENIATACQHAAIVTEVQIYVLRRQLTDGSLLDRSELDEAVVQACRALVLTNAEPLAGNARATLASVQVARPADVVDTDSTRIFGRIGVHVIRSTRCDRADLFASERLRSFAESQIARAPVGPVGWAAAAVPISGSDVGLPEIARSQRPPGSAARFGRMPSIWTAGHQERERLEIHVERWIDDLRNWRRERRQHASAGIHEQRSRAANELNRVQSAISDNAVSLWTNHNVDRPIAHVQEWIDRQRDIWSAEEEKRRFRLGRLHRTTDASARWSMRQSLDHLYQAMAQRPNFGLMAALALAVGAISGVFAWHALARAQELAQRASWMSDSTGEAIENARGVIVGIVLLGIALIALMTLIVSWHRQRRAWVEFVAQADTIYRQQARGLASEFDHLANHSHYKIVRSSLRQLGRLEAKLHGLTRQLRRAVAAPPVRLPVAAGPVSFIPAGQPSDDGEIFPVDAVELTDVSQLLRDEDMARQWVNDEASSWSAAAAERIKEEYLMRWDTIGADLSVVLREAVIPCQVDVAQYLLPQGRSTSYRQRLVFGTGRLGEIAREIVGGDVIVYASDGDEVLCCEVQMGLDPASVGP